MFRILRPVDLACIGIVTMVASTGVSASLGLKDAPALVAVTMGLACPAARRLIAWRRGQVAVRVGGDRASQAEVLLAMLPWLVLPVLHTLPWPEVSGIATTQVWLPIVARWTGVALTMAGVLRPFVGAFRETDGLTSGAYVETVGLFLATGSIFLGTLAVSWLLMQSGQARHRATHARRSPSPAPAIAVA